MMSEKYELDCRLCDNNRERFGSIEDVNESAWTDVSPMGVISSGVAVHNAYCPDHSLDD